MKLLMIVINEDDVLEPLIASLKEAGIGGGTIIESQGMNSLLYDLGNDQVPMFATIRLWVNDIRPHNKTIFSVIEDQFEDVALDIVSRALDNFSRPGKGIAFTMNLDKVIGYRSYDKE